MNVVNYRKASTYYLVGNLFNKGISFLTVPIFTRILSTTDYGIVTTYNSWIAILSMIVGFALHMGIRSAFIDYKNEIDDFMSVTTAFTITSGFVSGIFVLFGTILIHVDIGIELIILCMLQGVASALVQNYSMYLMMKYNYRFRTALMILPNLISAIFSVITILFFLHTDLFLGRIVPTALVNIFFGIMVLFLVFKRSFKIYNLEYLRYGLAISAPLVLHGIALNILSQSDRTMITLLSDASQTGIYSLIYNFSMLATVITTSLEGVWIPWFMSKYNDNKINEINEVTINYVHLITYAIVALMLVGPEIVTFLASEKYWEGICIIPPVVLTNYVIFLYTLYVNIEHYHKKTPYITVNTVIAASINLMLNFIFIPQYGYIAAAYTTLIAYLVAFILHARYAKKLEKNLYPMHIFIPSLMHILIAIVLFYIFLDWKSVRWCSIIIYICIMSYINRELLKRFFPSIVKKIKHK